MPVYGIFSVAFVPIYSNLSDIYYWDRIKSKLLKSIVIWVAFVVFINIYNRKVVCHIEPVNLIISKDVENVLPKSLINMLRYIWEAQCKHREARFILDKIDISHQNIVVCTKGKTKNIVVPYDTPMTAAVSFKKNITFTMDFD